MSALVIAWLLFGGAAYVAIALCRRAGRSSPAAGIVVRVLSSLGLWLLGCGLGLAHMVQLSASISGDYRTWLMHGGWWVVLVTGVVASVLP